MDHDIKKQAGLVILQPIVNLTQGLEPTANLQLIGKLFIMLRMFSIQELVGMKQLNHIMT